MKISTKLQYGLRFLMYLASANPKENVRLSDVAHSQNIPEKYLENIASIIKSGGYLDVKRGAYGGYRLSKKPEEINLKELFIALDNHILDFEEENDNPKGSTANYHVFSGFIRGLEGSISDYLEGITLADLAGKIKDREGSQMFYI